ncbi:GYDIA family GHMP kinase [Flagellimonas sp. CMM7]|uniref:GYDIA family GHMP kinase n=1 Tax=Flagellimonas sp. CMM7 TaxID=2654676 RepID=UPI0013D0FB6B|nr:GYDIA family GHMP kinase [Flagellimonas sp. CMM7]UII78261.1 GHMP kinase [Flagellimonas sp. CMM7]
MQKEFYSNGKLLLSGEYAILDGALGLAVPTKYGQSLKVTSTSSAGLLEWTSFDEKGKVWFSGSLNLDGLTLISSTDNAISRTLITLLSEAKSKNPSFLQNIGGLKVETHLDFPRLWGLGSSSTLINNIAQWAQVDAFQLLKNAFGGSGYDIACAQHDNPIFYQLENGAPKIEEVSFNPSFKDAIYFVYLNQKQSSKTAIATYREQEFNKESLLEDISEITKKMATSSSLSTFESLLLEHEKILSKVLGLETIKSKLFPDYSGSIKSLGAWGGDFIMATGDQKTPGYFKSKGFETVISFSELVL